MKAAIDVAANGTQLPGDLSDVVAPILPAAQQRCRWPRTNRCPRRPWRTCARRSPGLGTDPLLTERVTAKTLKIVGAVYDLHSGKVTLLP